MTEYRYDSIFSKNYDEKYGQIDPTHRRYVERLLSVSPVGCIVLDAACGTGKYWTMILASGRMVFGIDQSDMMLKLANRKYPEVPTAKLGLQEMHFTDQFFAAMCVDAMENICPEDWPLVLENFYCALKSGGHIYITVEIAEEREINEAYRRGIEMGLPVVYGEYVHHGGYHYYPQPVQVKTWLVKAGLHVVEESPGDGYFHFLAQKYGPKK
ncbi:MAG TPA: class I SAM-dependent methyltransferase [Clostridia bacterium]|nr:class I SAM-dependent methyltransferase [Clostridia bacterium]